ncbi:MAG: transcription-repair coupling factor [Pseudomonadota bacterium]
MTAAPQEAPKSNRQVIARAPEGVDAITLAKMVSHHQAQTSGKDARHWLHVTRDDQRMANLASQLAFFAPDLQIVTFPAWDCLPYDRVSPNRNLLAQRIQVYARLLAPAAKGPLLILTTVNGLSLRTPAKSFLEGRVLSLSVGQDLPSENLLSFLTANGYQRVDTVNDQGEFALRGGIIDVFPPGNGQPLRLDFFGDELESLRPFDPLTQRSSGKLKEAHFLPVSEVLLTEETIERFRGAYRQLFGRPKDDPLYESISESRPHPGMEHWLPLFYEHTSSLFDYLPDAPVTLDYQCEESFEARRETIEDFYQARKSLEGADETGGWIYRPIEPGLLYLGQNEWAARLEDRSGGVFTPFDAPDYAQKTIDAGGRPGLDFAAARQDPDVDLYDAVREAILGRQGQGVRILISGSSDGVRDRLGTVLKEHGLTGLQSTADLPAVQALPAGAIGLATLPLERGFAVEDLLAITEEDILGERMVRATARRKRPENFLTEVSSLEERDLVVHIDHGIGRYEGLQALEVGGAAHDCLKVVYHGGDKLFVPVENIDVLSRFGSEDAAVELDRLGGANWQARKARVKKRLKDIADELIKVAASREMKNADVLGAPEGLYDEFSARFPYPETEDQITAIDDTLADLQAGRPMDRLICGDVGFGKTEVALRAVFVAVMNGHQAAVVVPTTLLARQHFRTFQERFKGLPVEVRQLSRLVGLKEQGETKEGLEKGTVDLVIGTHALLAKSVKFRDLGLLIVDEEQHFGVKQKERLKVLREDVHVLTLTATPIPRTLQLAMSGVKEMSLIASPPVDRLAVRTFVLPYDPVIIREAILREHYRGGQTFYVCPRIADIDELQERLAKLVPEVKVAVAHGQMSPTALESVMTAFYDHKYDILLSTNIVESGLDIPTANTLILHRAHMFGLAQLYQLRGRIGRSKIRGYAYFTLPPGRLLTATAEKRLHVMQTLDSLGAGFQLASHDMDIRGAGNLLGEEQSGHVREVGIELYQQMLEEAVAKARGGGRASGEEEGAETPYSPQIALGTAVLIPENYVRDLSVRLGLYRRLSTLVSHEELEAFAAELIDRFGPLPEEVENLLQTMTIKNLCRDAGVAKLDTGPKGAVVTFHQDSFANPSGLITYIQSQAGAVKVRPDQKLVYQRNWENAQSRIKGARQLLTQLVKLARQASA